MVEIVQIVSVKSIKEVTQLHFNVDEKLVNPEVENVQRVHIEPLLGTPLYDRIIEGVSSNNLNAHEELLIDKYLLRVIAYYVLAELPEALSYQLYTVGGTQLISGQGNGLGFSDIANMNRTYRSKAETHARLLVNYLNENATETVLPLYLKRNCSKRTPGDDTYTCPFFLG